MREHDGACANAGEASPRCASLGDVCDQQHSKLAIMKDKSVDARWARQVYEWLQRRDERVRVGG